MRAVSMELEILGRHQHPDLTIPFLKVIFYICLLYSNLISTTKDNCQLSLVIFSVLKLKSPFPYVFPGKEAHLVHESLHQTF